MNEVILEKKSFDLGDVLFTKKFTLVNKILSGLERVHYIYAGCWCTSSKIVDDTLVVDFNVQAAVGDLAPNAYKVAPKYVEIWLDKDVQHFVAEEDTMERVQNPNKEVIKIPINYRAHGLLG